ncbi:MAG: hypothetical protein ACTIJA_02650 [Bavariicoccus seileri]|uniref:YolD-like family protein n=1 Tax=Bavariicoccus seileri TaxID=549685 RepID=A0A3D4S3S4_9ENTE|nr:hypothetical protein [Bavariicoccus seileri]HCS93457.1 hypothetical protein [Bavariicoccus seileri]
MEQLKITDIPTQKTLKDIIMPLHLVIKRINNAWESDLPVKVIAEFKDSKGFVYQSVIRGRVKSSVRYDRTTIIEDLDTRVEYIISLDQLLQVH